MNTRGRGSVQTKELQRAVHAGRGDEVGVGAKAYTGGCGCVVVEDGQFVPLLAQVNSAHHTMMMIMILMNLTITWVGVKNFGFTEEQKNIKQGSIKLKELHVCIMRVQKKMAAWRSEVP